MPYFLAIQNTYTDLQIALFKEKKCLAIVQTDKTKASKEVILLLQDLLAQHKLSFQQIEFIACNQGPGAFTTLRVVISTINGLSFATHIPLIGINALRALLDEYPNNVPTIALLNAFSHDLYYAIRTPDSQDIFQGCATIDHIFKTDLCNDKFILFIGNGADVQKESLLKLFGSRAQFLETNPQTCSIERIALLGLQQWEKQENLSFQLQPIYLKQATF